MAIVPELDPLDRMVFDWFLRCHRLNLYNTVSTFSGAFRDGLRMPDALTVAQSLGFEPTEFHLDKLADCADVIRANDLRNLKRK